MSFDVMLVTDFIMHYIVINLILWLINLGKYKSLLIRGIHEHVKHIINMIKNSRIGILTRIDTLA